MKYDIEFKPRAIKDLEALPARDRARIIEKISVLADDLIGSVKRLTNFTPEYRLRVGDYRVLFEVSQSEKPAGDETSDETRATVTIYRVIHRKDAYR